ncbi:amidohydrolase [Novosphingobium sp. PASSN1]|uniref:amidohydrolase n=1 Tax=Novosphingobium sp. PASSN1 TaxID=2015561 RepID=UPI000BCDD5E4|nr:amidohydrolase [Novosphingobium sp. PASSN1]OYU36884.1 MAG: amidohydrolase [Novosphingobium sp. PASSN1]
MISTNAARSAIRLRSAFLAGAVLAGAALAGGPALAQPAPVDLVFLHGTVLTPGGTAQALAVAGGTIVATGTDAEIAAMAAPSARTVDLAGRTVMPGLYDMHVHTYFAGRDKLSCRFAQGADAKAIVAAVKACAAKAKPGEWITGGSWVGAAFKPGEQTKRLLDAVAPGNPVMLNDESLHSVWVNSKVLAIAGITRATKDGPGGVIDRDAKGEPTGVLREVAARDIERFMPKATTEQQMQAIKVATDEMLSYGIVGFTDAAVRREMIEGFSAYARSGGLKQYARGCIVWGPNNGGSEALIPERQAWSAGRLQLDCVKMFLDGVPLEGRTAVMLAPYEHDSAAHADHGPGEGRGLKLIPEDKLFPAVTAFDRQGIQVKFHAAGDGAVREAVEAIAAARKANGDMGPHHEIGHNTFIDTADVPRGRDLHFTWELSPYIWWPTPITSVDIARAVGPERMKRLWPMRDVLESGANVVTGSDWPVVPSVNPWLAFETLVTRQVPGATGDPINAGQRITREQAMAVFTRNGAAEMGRLDRGGTLEPGKQADLIVLDRNPLTVAVGDIHDTRVLATYIAGEEVFTAAVGEKK